jgi:hypothetical protein
VGRVVGVEEVVVVVVGKVVHNIRRMAQAWQISCHLKDEN